MINGIDVLYKTYHAKFEYKYSRWILASSKKYLSFNAKNNGIMERFCIFVKKKKVQFCILLYYHSLNKAFIFCRIHYIFVNLGIRYQYVQYDLRNVLKLFPTHDINLKF